MHLPTRLRTATASDAAEIALVHVDGWRWGYRDLMPEKLLGLVDGEGRIERWRRALEEASRTTWVAVRDGVVVGFLAAGEGRDAGAQRLDGYFEIHALYQVERVARTGVARALLTTALADFRDRGAGGGFLWVLSSNLGARKFYERAGFRADGASKVETLAGVDLPHSRYVLAFA